MLQDIINKNEIAAENSIKLIETSLTEIGVEASTQTGTGGLTFRNDRFYFNGFGDDLWSFDRSSTGWS